jgi:hypothetical protein
MKKTHTAISALIVILILSMIGIASANDQLIDSKIESIVTKLDKNGQEYTRIMIIEKRELSGVKYEAAVPVMCFQPVSDQVKIMTKGTKIKMVVRPQQYNGSTSYTAIALVK